MTASRHPYKDMPDQAFWARAAGNNIGNGIVPWGLVPESHTPLITPEDRLVSAGSCFAANIIPYLEKAGLNYLRTERRHPDFSDLPADNYSYDVFSAAYGNIYTPRHLLQLLRRCLGTFHPKEDRWITPEGVIDPFRPGLRYPAASEREFEALTRQHLRRTLQAFTECSVLIFTFGLTEAWESIADGAIFPSCPGTVRGTFDPTAHRFVNFTAEEAATDFLQFAAELRAINPGVRFILTVSPVALVATASQKHVVVASALSKARLVVAAHRCAEELPATTYFPAYEIVTSGSYFEGDRRSVTELGVASVMDCLLANCRPGDAPVSPAAQASFKGLSDALMQAECEEAAAGF